MGARDVDEGDDRQPEALGELHDPHRLAVALRVGHPEVAPDVLVGVGALLLADDHDPPAVEPGEPGDHRRVVAEQPVAVELDEVVGHRLDELERPRPAQVAGELDPRPDRRRVGDRRRAVGRRLGRGRRRSGCAVAAGQLADPVGERREERQRPEGRRRRRRGRPGRRRRRRRATGSRRSSADQLVAQRRAARRRGRRSRARTGTRRAGSRPAAPARSCPAETRAPANPMSAFGSARLTSPTAANEANTPPVVGSDRTEMNGTPAARRRSSAASVLASCIRASVPSCIRAPPEALTTTSGTRVVERVLGGAGHLLADDRAHRAAHEPEVHDADRDRRGRRSAPVPHTAASRIPVAACAAASRSG